MAEEHPLQTNAMIRLMSLGGEQLQIRMARLFSHHTPQRIAAIRAGLETGDWKQIMEAAHSLRSTAALVGAGEIERLAALIEQRVELGQRDPVPDLVNQIDAALNTLLGNWIVCGLLPLREDGC